MTSPILCLTEVEWREVGELVPEESTWARNQTCPLEGELRWCKVHLETREWLNVGYKRWLLYQMGSSLFNGINTPEELDALAIVEAEVLAVEPVSTSMPGVIQWWKVLCLRVIPLAAIPHRLPPLPLVDLDDFRPRGKLECASEKLYLYSWGVQVSETKIYAQETVPYSPTYLVFYERSIDNECEIYNWPIK